MKETYTFSISIDHIQYIAHAEADYELDWRKLSQAAKEIDISFGRFKENQHCFRAV
jgi:hypothetical protein